MKFLIAIPVLVVGLIVFLSIYLQPNSFIGCSKVPNAETNNCTKADAIVVVSGGDTQARTTAGIELYNNGWANYLVLSGAAQDPMSQSNAAAMMQQAEAAGVPRAAIFIDEYAVNTQQNAQNTHSIFSEHGFTDVILVTSGYHQRRASLEFTKHSEGVIVRNHPVIGGNDWGWFWWLTPRGWWLATSEAVKVIAFYLGATS